MTVESRPGDTQSAASIRLRDRIRQLDRVQLEIMKNQFQGIVDEMGQTVMRAGHTVFVKETQDFVVTLVTPEGEAFACSKRVGIWIAIGLPFRAYIEQIGTPNEGDVFITNDPETTKGLITHLPDFFILKPIFVDGQLVCYASAFIHCTDVSGLAPGSVAPSAYEQFQEGIIVPPVKLIDRGTMNEDVLRIFLANTRGPDQNWGDLKALIGTVNKAEARVHQLVEKYGFESVRESIYQVLDYAELQARDIITSIPDDVYSFSDYLEGDVIPGGRPIRIKLDLVVQGDELILDFSDTDPQVRAALNFPSHGQTGHYLLVIGLISFYRTVAPDITYNTGLVRSAKVRVPRGSLLNPEPRAACGARQATFFRVAEVVLGALGQALPKEMPAAGCGQGSILFVSVPDIQTGSVKVSIVQPLLGGSGARPMKDGTDGVDFQTGFYRNIPTEILETEMPVLIERYRLRPDSGGPGQFRGGTGIDYAIRLFPPNGVLTSRAMERYHFQPWGREGGSPGANGRTLLEYRGETKDIGKIDILQTPPSGVVAIATAGGGGYGDPLERDPELVLRDVEDELVSVDAAREQYGVVIVDGKVDEVATAKVRSSKLRPPKQRFVFGPYREAYEKRWPHELQRGVNVTTDAYPAAVRHFLRGRLIEEVDRRIDAGETVSPNELPAMFERILSEIEMSALEGA